MTRIYNKNTDISEELVRDFYDSRANRYAELGNRSVLLGDHHPEIAETIDQFETAEILPMISEKGRILDIGCGVGRWAKKLIPQADYYLGIDISPIMIEKAKSNASLGNAEFKCLSLKEVLSGSFGVFNTIIFSEVAMYINDDVLRDIFENFNNILSSKCKVYFCETIGLNERLTLKNHPSDALKANYSVIYRKQNDYIEYWTSLGFTIIDQGLFDCTNNGETSRWWVLLDR